MVDLPWLWEEVNHRSIDTVNRLSCSWLSKRHVSSIHNLLLTLRLLSLSVKIPQLPSYNGLLSPSDRSRIRKHIVTSNGAKQDSGNSGCCLQQLNPERVETHDLDVIPERVQHESRVVTLGIQWPLARVTIWDATSIS